MYNADIELDMEVHPKVNALVLARGQEERFTVFSVYEKRKTADLKSVATPGNPAFLLQDVPWAEISYIEEARACTDAGTEISLGEKTEVRLPILS
jgi:hypothetical protein